MPAGSTLLFLYMVPETGHQKAAEAVMEAASHMDPRASCVGLDAANHSYPFLSTMFNRVYIQMLKRAPFIWQFLYDNPDIEEATREVRDLLTFLTSFRTKRLLNRFHPAAVICTQAAPAVALAAERRRGHLPIPFVCVVTDFGVHSYWVHPEVDLYLVPHEEIKQQLVRKGIAENRVRVTGIPIRPTFGETMDPAEARLRLRLHPHKSTLLVMGGSQGLGTTDELVSALSSIPMPLQTVVVCGRNRRLQKKLARLASNLPDFHVHGWIRDAAAHMSAADLLITKPGGLTCSEALAKQLPMILANPIPGQEERNVRFLTRHRVAAVAGSTEDLLHAVMDLLRHPKKISAMRQRAKLIARPYSAWESARLIFDLVNKRAAFKAVR